MNQQQPEVFETQKFKANLCPDHPYADFKIYCGCDALMKQGRADIIVQKGSDMVRRFSPIIVQCLGEKCSRLTFHGHRGYYWMSVAPRRWRKRVVFSWDEQLVPEDRHLHNLNWLTYILRRKDPITLHFAHESSGWIIFEQASSLNEIVEAYIYGSKRCFIKELRRVKSFSDVRLSDAITDLFRKYKESGEACDKYRKLSTALLVAIQNAIVDIHETRATAEIKRLKQCRENLQRVLTENNFPLPDLKKPAPEKAPVK